MHSLSQQVLQLFRRKPTEAAAVLEAWSIAYPQGLAAIAQLLGAVAAKQIAEALPEVEAESFQAAVAVSVPPRVLAVAAAELRSSAIAMQVEIEAQSDTACALAGAVKSLADARNNASDRAAVRIKPTLSQNESRELLENAQGLAIAYPERTAAVLRNWLLQG